MSKCKQVTGRKGAATFYAWLRRHRSCESGIGDLARDAAKYRWPGKYHAGAGSWRRRLAEEGACSGAIDALDRAINFWESGLTYCRFD